jgi:hypothetical protein
MMLIHFHGQRFFERCDELLTVTFSIQLISKRQYSFPMRPQMPRADYFSRLALSDTVLSPPDASFRGSFNILQLSLFDQHRHQSPVLDKNVCMPVGRGLFVREGKSL